MCWSFTKGALGPGVHVGVITDAPGAWAERMAAHDSMLIPVPDSVCDEAAVLADPFSVSFHAIVRHPPPPSGRAVVYGAGALGLTSIAILRALYPDVEVAAVPASRPRRPWRSGSAPRWSSTTSRLSPWWRPWPSGPAGCCTSPCSVCP